MSSHIDEDDDVVVLVQEEEEEEEETKHAATSVGVPPASSKGRPMPTIVYEYNSAGGAS